MIKFIQIASALFSLVILYLILFATKQQGIPLFYWAESIPYGDKLGHVGLSAMLVLFLSAVTRCKSFKIAGIPVYWSFAAALALLTFGEITHHFNAARSFEWGDLLANLTGTLFGVAISALVYDRVHPFTKRYR